MGRTREGIDGADQQGGGPDLDRWGRPGKERMEQQTGRREGVARKGMPGARETEECGEGEGVGGAREG